MKFLQVNGVGHVEIFLPRWWISCCIQPLLLSKQRHMPSEPLWILYTIYASFGYVILSHLPSDPKSDDWDAKEEKAI